MSRFLAAFQNDVILQVRKNFYTVSILLALAFSISFSFLFEADQIRHVLPATMLFIVGGSSLLFAGGLVIDEKDKGILNALVVSPLSQGEYLGAKILSLTFLSTIEVAIMVAGPLLKHSGTEVVTNLNYPLLALGIICLNLIYTLLGMAITVRFKQITDYVLPVAVLVLFLEVPVIYFFGISENLLLLAIPSAAPVMLIQSAFIRLSRAEWIFTLIYLCIEILLLSVWAWKSFQRNILRKLV